MAKSTTDDEDSLKRAARRRLVGAVVLTIIIVTLLPFLLDNEPNSKRLDIELRIPDKDQVAAFNPKMPTAAPPSVDVTDIGNRPADVVTQPAASVPIASTPAAATKPQESAKPSPAKQAAPKEPAKQTNTSKPAANKTPPAPHQATPQTAFIIQAGAFSNANTAQELQQKLSKMGLQAYTEKVDDITRVRAGPYASRAEADQVMQKLVAQGLKPVISLSATNTAN